MGALKKFVIKKDFFQRTAYYMSLTLISLSAPSTKVNGFNASASKHIALAFLVAVVTSCYNAYNFILQDEASDARKTIVSLRSDNGEILRRQT